MNLETTRRSTEKLIEHARYLEDRLEKKFLYLGSRLYVHELYWKSI